MDSNNAIRAHSAWKLRLAVYLNHPDGSLSVDEVNADDRCELGKWICENEAQYASLPEYIQMKEAHAGFHHTAARIVGDANSGKQVNVATSLSNSSDFGAASIAVVKAISTFGRCVATGASTP